MQITMNGKHVEVTEALRAHAQKKLEKLSRYFDHIREVQVTQSLQRSWHIVEVTVHADGLLLRAEERSPDMYTSIDLVVEKLERQLKKYKGKLIDKSREVPFPEAAPGEQESRIVRTKRFAIKPMSPEEAALQMELLGHDFFVFSDAETNQVNVIYRRKDGNYGLIEPEFD